ncbi:MAG: lytic transglycosylase domain-containing protein, partial [Pusillimonas sp.]|nr:lytic transglycosylase domain-containing protein [Pusillimonas sp.]
MMQTNSGQTLVRIFRSVRHQLAELVHVCAVYLGLAVLVTVGLSLTVPALKEQTRQVHTALLASLRPASLQIDLFSLPDRGFSFGTLLSEPDWARSEWAEASVPDAMPDADQPFSQAMAEADNFVIPGVTSEQSKALRSYIARKYRI